MSSAATDSPVRFERLPDEIRALVTRHRQLGPDPACGVMWFANGDELSLTIFDELRRPAPALGTIVAAGAGMLPLTYGTNWTDAVESPDLATLRHTLEDLAATAMAAKKRMARADRARDLRARGRTPTSRAAGACSGRPARSRRPGTC